MSHFGQKNRRDYTAADNATLAVSAMLGAEMRNKRIAHTESRKRMYAAITGLVIAGVYLALHFAFGW